jgi:hypothetical protein
VVCVIVSLFVERNVSVNAPAAALESKPAEALTIEMSTVAACACSAITKNKGCRENQRDRATYPQSSLPFSERCTAPSPPGWSGNVRPWRTS